MGTQTLRGTCLAHDEAVFVELIQAFRASAVAHNLKVIGAPHTIAGAIFFADIRTGKFVLAHDTTGKIEATAVRG